MDENVVKVHNNEDIKLLRQDLIYIALESGQCVGQSKKHYLILEVVIAGSENYLSFISFFNFYLIIGIDKIKLDEN